MQLVESNVHLEISIYFWENQLFLKNTIVFMLYYFICSELVSDTNLTDFFLEDRI